MGTIIDMVAVSTPIFSRWGIRSNSIKLAAKAARQCLKNANLDSNFLEILVYTGVYKSNHIWEPAIASLIQSKIRSNPLQRRNFANGKSLPDDTFSLDLNNGGCGLISGLQVVDGFLRSERFKKGMVVTGDNEPDPGFSEGFCFTPAAAAMILSQGNENEGFVMFKTTTYPQYKEDFDGHIIFSQQKKRNILVIRKSEFYLSRCVECAQTSLEEFFKDTEVKLNCVDLIIPSQFPAGFPVKLGSSLGLDRRLVVEEKNAGQFHTAGPVFALEKAWTDQRFKQAKNILFITVGAGITTAIALYKNQ